MGLGIEHLTVVMITISVNLAYDASTLKVTDFYEHSTLKGISVLAH